MSVSGIERSTAASWATRGDAEPPDVPSGPTEPGFWGRIHPIGYVAVGLLALAAIFHTLIDTRYLIGNFSWWHWATLVVLAVLGLFPMALHRLRVGLEVLPSFTGTLAWILAWFVFIVQLFNVITRYGNDLVEQDILFGETTSLAWQSFGLLFILGANYGLKAGVNPRIDFWWADFTNRTKGWIDFVLHVALLMPFTLMAIRILRPYAGTSLGQKRDGSWPEGWRVWETWEESPDADQLPVGPIKAMLLVAFVLFAIQLVAEIIKAGFLMIGRDDLGDMQASDAPLRVE